MKASGTIVPLVEQNVGGALALADRFYAIERGTVVMSGEAGNANKARLMEAIAV